MALEERRAELLRGYQIVSHPSMPTLRVLRLDTANENWFCVVTREVLLKLIEELQKHADKMEPTH